MTYTHLNRNHLHIPTSSYLSLAVLVHQAHVTPNPRRKFDFEEILNVFPVACLDLKTQPLPVHL